MSEAAKDLAMALQADPAISGTEAKPLRLLTRFFTQIERVLSVNNLHMGSTVVEAARDALAIEPG
jgi:hypothetical protein